MYQTGKPTKKVIKEFVRNYNQENPYSRMTYDAALSLAKSFPSNKSFKDITIKVSFLNDAFKTRIGDTMQVAKSLSQIKGIDRRLKDNDISLVDEIGLYSSKERNYHFYSFATKYCHIHNPDSFPIYDSFVKESLEYYRDNFEDYPHFYTSHLRNYSAFIRIINEFKLYSNAKDLGNSIIDRFLWAQSKPA